MDKILSAEQFTSQTNIGSTIDSKVMEKCTQEIVKAQQVAKLNGDEVIIIPGTYSKIELECFTKMMGAKGYDMWKTKIGIHFTPVKKRYSTSDFDFGPTFPWNTHKYSDGGDNKSGFTFFG